MSDKPAEWRILDEITAAVYDHPEGFTVPFHESATIKDLVWFQHRMALRLPKYEFAVMRDEQERLHLTVVPVGSEVDGVESGASPAASSALAEGRAGC